MLVVSQGSNLCLQIGWYARAKDDLVQEQLPGGAPVLRAHERFLEPLFLNGADDAPLGVELLRELGHIVDVVAEVGDVAVILAVVSARGLWQELSITVIRVTGRAVELDSHRGKKKHTECRGRRPRAGRQS